MPEILLSTAVIHCNSCLLTVAHIITELTRMKSLRTMSTDWRISRSSDCCDGCTVKDDTLCSLIMTLMMTAYDT